MAARSPDLTPLDYFHWGYLKSKVYSTQPQSLDELQNRILQEATLIDREMIRNSVRTSSLKRERQGDSR